MINLARNGFSHEQIKNVLHMAQGDRTSRFVFHLLDKDENFITELKTVEGGNMEFSAFSDIKRTANVQLKEGSYGREAYVTMQDIGHLTMQEIYARDWSGT